MSTILEALKKSEQERKLNNIPTLSNMAAPQEVSRWPMFSFVALAVFLLILLGFIAFGWFNGNGFLAQDSSTEGALVTPVAITNESVSADTPKSESDEIVVNVVSYSDQAEQSFVMINGKLVREGEFVRGGLKVEKISPNKVVLNLRGRRIVRSP